MHEDRYPTLDEFFRRLEVRDVEPDLRAELSDRLNREGRSVRRVGNEDTVKAVAERIVPGAVPPTALAAFLDDVFDKQVGRADDKDGLMPRAELIPRGFRVLEQEARKRQNRGFSSLSGDQQDELLGEAEKGNLRDTPTFDSATWFKRTRALLLLGYGSDPRGMVEMGFPGPSYKPGHVWLDEGEIQARVQRRRGYLTL
jgi:hypothetical protein